MSNINDRVKALLAYPSVPGLVYALRHREVWPENFKWNFLRNRSCAMGLACKLWREIPGPFPEDVGHFLNLKPEYSYKVFYGSDNFYGNSCNSVYITPEIVANALERMAQP